MKIIHGHGLEILAFDDETKARHYFRLASDQP
jgi:hypothetical protein